VRGQFESRYAKSKAPPRDAKLQVKDLLSLTFSAMALTLSLVTAWFNLFYYHPSLKMAATQFQPTLDIAGPRAEVQNLHSTYDIAFVNDGNKPVLVTWIDQSFASVGEKAKKSLREIYNSYENCTSEELEKISSEHPRVSGIANIIVKPGEFYVKENIDIETLFYTDNIADDYFLVCLNVYYVTPNGIPGNSNIAAAVFHMVKNRGVVSLADSYTSDRLHDVLR
jgi:hypothetical protein